LLAIRLNGGRPGCLPRRFSLAGRLNGCRLALATVVF